MKGFARGLLAGIVLTSAAGATEFSLRDGSLVVGEILSLDNGSDLVVYSEHMGEVTLQWGALQRISGTRVVGIELIDGRRVTGSIFLDEHGMTIAGETTLQVAPGDVFTIREVFGDFWHGLDAYTDLGMNLVRGNSRVSQLSFGAGLDYETVEYRTLLDATVLLNEQEEADDTRRITLATSYTHKLEQGWSTTALYQFESDEQQGLEGRSLLGGSVNRRVLTSLTQQLELSAGLVVNSEDFEQASAEESLEALLGARYRLRAATELDASLTLFPNLEQEDRYRVQADAGLSVGLYEDFNFKLTLYDRYDSEPPAGNEKNDYGITLGIRWEY